MATISSLTADTYYYTFRYRMGSNSCYVYGGYNGGFWDGTSNVNGTLVVNSLPTVSTIGDTSICSGDSISLSAIGGSTYSWSTTETSSTITVNPTTTTTYIVTGSDANGCSNSDSVLVTVNTLPTVTLNGGIDVEICLGQSTNLTAAGGSTYVWSTGATSTSVSVSPTDTTSYSVIGTDANGCIGYDTIGVIVNPLPVVFAGNDTAYCAGDSVTLSASGASTYMWNNGVVNGVPLCQLFQMYQQQ